MPPRPFPTVHALTRRFQCARKPPPLITYSRGYATEASKSSKAASAKKAKPTRTHFELNDLGRIDQFSLTDAMRYIRAMEVGQDPFRSKYELHIKLSTVKSGPTIKSRIRFPKAVKTDMRVWVIAEGKHAEVAKIMGAALVGTDEIFEKARKGDLDVDRIICHDKSSHLLNAARLGKALGPKGLMPSAKTGTMVSNVGSAMRELTGKMDYRERLGVIRIAVGQLAFSESDLEKNIKALMEQLKQEFGAISHQAEKSINEVVLSSTNSAGFSLNGEVRSMRTVQSTA